MNSLLDTQFRNDLVVPVLGIMPLLVVADTVSTGTTAGIIILLVMVLLGLVISIIRNLLPLEIRQTGILLVSASIVAVIALLTQYWFYESYLYLGIYLPLIAVNCLVLAWAEEYALRHGVFKTFFYSLMAGAGLLLVLVILAAVREFSGLPFLKQPAGAFLTVGMLAAFYNFARYRLEQ